MGKLERLDVVYAERLQGHGPWIFAAPGTGCWRPPHPAHPVIAAISVIGPVSRARQALPSRRAAVIGAAAVASTGSTCPGRTGRRTPRPTFGSGHRSARAELPLVSFGAVGRISW